jgi:hypothetical protein
MRKNKNKKLRSSCPKSSRLLRRKILFRDLGQNLLRNPRSEDQTHRLQGERKRTGAAGVGSQDIANKNILREGRKRR